MKRYFTFVLCAVLATALCLAACEGEGKDQEDISLSPFLYPDTFEIIPNPAESGDKVKFFFGFSDHDGDVEDGQLVVRLEDDAGNITGIEIDDDDWEIEGTTHGSIEFELEVIETGQGEYLVYFIDEAGNVSNEISEYLFVNPPVPDDDDA